MTCHGYDMIIVCLSLITGISEILALLKGVECNGIVDFVIRRVTTRQRCADTDSAHNPTAVIELPNVPIQQTAEIPIRTSVERANLPQPLLNPLLPNLN